MAHDPMAGRTIWILWFALACLFLVRTAEAACAPPAGRLHYDVFNDGQLVGGVWIDIARNGEAMQVSTLIKVKVALLHVIPLLNYRHQSEEIWIEDAFHRFTGRTVDNGRAYDIRIEPNGVGLKVETNGNISEIATPLLSHAVWCEASIAGSKIFSPLKGRMKDFASEYLGEKAITIAGRTRVARAYALTQMRNGKPVPGRLWYGEDGIVVKASFLSKRKTVVTFDRD